MAGEQIKFPAGVSTTQRSVLSMTRTRQQLAALERLRERIRAHPVASVPIAKEEPVSIAEPEQPRPALPGLRPQPPANLTLDQLLADPAEQRRGRR